MNISSIFTLIFIYLLIVKTLKKLKKRTEKKGTQYGCLISNGALLAPNDLEYSEHKKLLEHFLCLPITT